MNDHSSSTSGKESALPKEEIKREIKQEIAEAIQGRSEDSEKKNDSRKSDEKKGDGTGSKDQQEKPRFQWTPAKLIGLMAVIFIVAVVGTYYFTYILSHETTDDAYTAGYVHQISSRVTGNVIELLIVDNQFVKQGQVLLKLDPRDYQVQVAKAQATYDRAKADFDRVDALKDDVAISKQDSRLGFPQHAGPRQRASALADVCRSGRHASQPTCGAVGALSAGGVASGQAALWPIPECTQWRCPES